MLDLVGFFCLFIFKCRCLSFYFILFIYFGHAKRCGILVPQLGIEPTPTAVEAGVLTTRLPGKSLDLSLF